MDKFIKMNKKGFLLAEETLKIVIALISISFLIYFLVSLYMANQDSKNLELAKSSLDHLVEEINSGSTEVEIYNPQGWVVLSWPNEGKSPKSCENLNWDNCLCICNDLGFQTSNSYLDRCDDQGICMQVLKKTIVGGFIGQHPLTIERPFLSLEIKYGNEIIINKK